MPSLSAMPTPPQETILLSATQRKALETSLERADDLDALGYKLAATARPLVYEVIKPEPETDRKTGEVIDRYIVDLSGQGSCTCKQWYFSKGQGCKHFRWTLAKIRDAYNWIAPLLVSSGLELSPTAARQIAPPAPTLPAPTPLLCPLCGHGSTTTVPDQPGQRVCLKCLGFFDEIQSPGFGAMKPSPVERQQLPSSQAQDRPKLTFATAPVEGSALRRNPPAPSLSAPAPKKAGRGVPYCQKCACIMQPAVSERTGQEGHLCMICSAWLPLGSYKAHTKPQDPIILLSERNAPHA